MFPNPKASGIPTIFGKPLGTIEGNAVVEHMEKVMTGRESVRGYITRAMSFATYRQLVDQYNLAE